MSTRLHREIAEAAPPARAEDEAPAPGGELRRMAMLRRRVQRSAKEAPEAAPEAAGPGEKKHDPAAERKHRIKEMVEGYKGEVELGEANVGVGGTVTSIASSLGLKFLCGPASLIAGPAIALVEMWQSDEKKAEIAQVESLLDTLHEINDPAVLDELEAKVLEFRHSLSMLDAAIGEAAAKNPAERSAESKVSPDTQKEQLELLEVMRGLAEDPEVVDRKMTDRVLAIRNPERLRRIRAKLLEAGGANAAQRENAMKEPLVVQSGDKQILSGARHGGMRPGPKRGKGDDGKAPLGEKLMEVNELEDHLIEGAEWVEESAELTEKGGEAAEHAGHAADAGAMSVLGKLGLAAKAVKLAQLAVKMPQIRSAIAAGDAAAAEAVEARAHSNHGA